MKRNQGITLIALVVTIIILIILAGVSINLVLGENGILTMAKRATEEMKISEGKEKIELALLDMNTDRVSQGKSCDLDYVSDNIDGKIKDVTLESIKGNPVVKIYLSYKDIMYKVTEDLRVVVVGNIDIEEEPELEIIRDTTVTGVDKVELTVKATVEEGEISEIVKPDGSIEYVSELTYTVAENGSYTFKAVTEKGIIEEKTINIQSINIKDAIELADSSGDGTVTCTHIYETKYDDTNHWKQCILCNNKVDSVSHNIVIEGTETCSISYSAQIKYCTDGCGYKVKLPKKEHSNLTWRCNGAGYAHRYTCGACNANIKQERCYDENGINIGCDTGNIGTCVVCGGTYASTEHRTIRQGKCDVCGEKFYDMTSTYEIIDEMTTKYTWHIENIKEGLIDIEGYTRGVIMQNPNIGAQVTETNIVQNSDGSIDATTVLKATQDNSTKQSQVALRLQGKYNGNLIYLVEYSYAHKLVADNYAPSIKSIIVDGADSLEEFSRNATITAEFEETWDSIVEMALFDENGNVISDWSIASKDGTTFKKEFNVIIETTTSKELTVKAKDRCGNIGEGKVTIGKIDTKPPTLVSQKQYNDKWKISLPIKIEATDEGSGNVQIGLGSESDYKLASKEAEKYYRNYHFVGDIYEDIVRIVYLKDAVGNVVTNRITIGKLDRTSPTITNINQDGKNIVIEANDINTKLNKEGSGISGYAISKSREVPVDNAFQTSNTFTVEDTGTYYIWVKDNAGNLSYTKQIEVN